jgi:hypothetical protein
MLEWILLVILLLFVAYMYMYGPNLFGTPSRCNSCSKRTENPAE